MYHPDLIRSPDGCPTLVLNADYTPLSYYPLSLWPWQTSIKAVFLDRVDIVASYEREVHSPNLDMKIPSVIALKKYIKPSEYPAFTRFNLFLRDKFQCLYCGSTDHLTFDHVIPRRQKGRTTWENVATACLPCNLKKGAGHQKRHICICRGAPLSQQAGNYRNKAARSRRTSCTIHGAIGSIGILSWKVKRGDYNTI